MPRINHQTIIGNRDAVKTLIQQLKRIKEYTEAKKVDDIEKYSKLELELSYEAPKINQIFLDAGISPTIGYGNMIQAQQRNIAQEIPWFVRLHTGEDDLLGMRVRSHSKDTNIMNDIQNYYIGLIRIYDEKKLTAWVNLSIYPLKFILKLPANVIKFLFSHIFDIDVSNNNFIWRISSLIINFMSWFATVLPLLDRMGYTEQINMVLAFIKIN
jgi:hypothetical protein